MADLNKLKNELDKLLQDIDYTSLEKAAVDMSQSYRNKEGSKKRIVTEELDALAYAASRMPATYQAVHDSLSYALENTDLSIKSLLDVGAGTGGASWAATDLLDLSDITLVEREEGMITVGKALFLDAGVPLSSAKWIKSSIQDLIMEEKPDLVIASYVMNELSNKDMQNAVKKLWEHTGKLLLIVEPGTPVGYRNIIKIRSTILEEGGYVIAPCTHMYDCAMEKDDWCHFYCRVERSRLHKQLKGGDAPYEDEKYSFMAFVKQEQPLAKYRVLRHPKIGKGHVILTVCSAKQIMNMTCSKKEQDRYKAAKKLKAGDSFY